MNEMTKHPGKTHYFDACDYSAHIQLGNCITQLLQKMQAQRYTPIILCIGTDRATGDCLGPLVGEQLLGCSETVEVIGSLSAPVHALNIRNVVYDIQSCCERPFVIAVDASLGIRSHVGLITVSDGPIFPGKGVQKKLPAIGDISITGIVNISGGHPGMLQSTRLYTVMRLANCIADALKSSIRYLDTF